MRPARPHLVLTPPRALPPVMTPPVVTPTAVHASRRMLLAAVLFQAVSGLVGGVPLVIDPSGALLGLPESLIERVPLLDSYLLPGLVLLGPLGLFALILAWGLWRRPAQRWPADGALLLGLGLVAWIVVEVAIMAALHWAHLLYGGLGAVITLLAVRVRRAVH